MKEQKGITLIALVITIIVLLILAGVSIAMLTGQNGILTRATDSGDKTEKAAIAEKVNMAIQSAYTDAVIANAASPSINASDICAKYNAENSGETAAPTTTAEGADATITVKVSSTVYTVNLTSVGNSYTTSTDDVSK